MNQAIKEVYLKMALESIEESYEFHDSIDCSKDPFFLSIMKITLIDINKAIKINDLPKICAILQTLFEVGIRVGMRISELNKERNNATTLQSDT